MKSLLSMLCAALLLSACVSLKIHPGNTDRFMPTAYAVYLTDLNAEQLARELDQAKSAWQDDPSAANRVRMGLVRGQWGYAGYRPEQAAEDINAGLLDAQADWLTVERDFLAYQATQLLHFSQRQSESALNSGRVQALQRELRQAQEKLRAVGDIERSLAH